MRRLTDKATDRGDETIFYDQAKSSVEEYRIDFTPQADYSGTSVSSVEWLIEYGNSVLISDESLTSNLASANITGSNVGRATLKVKASMANGAIRVKHIEINVTEPHTRSYRDDYGYDYARQTS